MDSILTSIVVFMSIAGGTVIGILLRKRLPDHHLTSESRDMVKTGAGLIGTMAALLLGLLVASAKSSYDTEKGEVTQMAARIAYLDRVLATYGPETQTSRS